MHKFIKLTGWLSGQSVFLNIDHIVNVSTPSDVQGANVFMDVENASCIVKESPEEIIKFIEEECL